MGGERRRKSQTIDGYTLSYIHPPEDLNDDGLVEYDEDGKPIGVIAREARTSAPEPPQ